MQLIANHPGFFAEENLINFYLTNGTPAKSAYESVAIFTMSIIQPIPKILNVMSLRKSLPICQGKNHGFRPSQKESTFSCFYCCNNIWMKNFTQSLSKKTLIHLYALILHSSTKNYNQLSKRIQVLKSICFYSISPNISMPAATATLSDSACPLIGI